MNNIFKAIVSILLHTIPSGQEKATHGSPHSELVVECIIQIEQSCNLLKPAVNQFSSLGIPHAGSVFFPLVMEQTSFWSVLPNTFFDATFVNCSNTDAGNRDPQRPPVFHTESLLV